MNQPAPLPPSRWQSFRLLLRRAFSWQLHTITVTESERSKLLNQGVTQDPLHRYAVWRRSVLLVVLIPALLAAILSTIDLLSGRHEGLTRIGKILTFANTIVIWALPITTILTLRYWLSFRLSQRILILGWFITFIPPFLIALVPTNWWFETGNLPVHEPQLQREAAVIDILNALHVTFTLLPTALAILPGLVRACLRVKTLLPAAILPGWFLVITTPFYFLLALVVLVALNNMAGSPWLVLGMMFTLSSSMIYVAQGNLFVRPLSSEETPAINRTHQLSRLAALIGAVLLLVYLFTKQIFGLYLVGLDSQKSMVWLWEHRHEMNLVPGQALAQAQSIFWVGEISLFQVVVQYCGRTLFMTAVFADTLVRMTLIAWNQARRFQQTPAAMEYDETMVELQHALTLESEQS